MSSERHLIFCKNMFPATRIGSDPCSDLGLWDKKFLHQKKGRKEAELITLLLSSGSVCHYFCPSIITRKIHWALALLIAWNSPWNKNTHTHKKKKHAGLKTMKSVTDFLVSSKCERCSVCLKNEAYCGTPRQLFSLQMPFEAVKPMSKLGNFRHAPRPDHVPRLWFLLFEKTTALTPLVSPRQCQPDISTPNAENCLGRSQLTDLLWHTWWQM